MKQRYDDIDEYIADLKMEIAANEQCATHHYNLGLALLSKRDFVGAEEALLIANAVEGWLKEVKPDGETFTPFEIPQSAEGYGCTEAPRGSLVHYIRVKDQKIDSYQIISATLWNCSPRDDKGRRGPLEEALIGVQVPDINTPVNVGRTIRAFDP